MPSPIAPLPPWHSPASLRAGLPSAPEAWAARVAAALAGAPTVPAAALALGLEHRTLQRLLAHLRDGWPELAAALPPSRPGGYREAHAQRARRGSRDSAGERVTNHVATMTRMSQ